MSVEAGNTELCCCFFGGGGGGGYFIRQPKWARKKKAGPSVLLVTSLMILILIIIIIEAGHVLLWTGNEEPVLQQHWSGSQHLGAPPHLVCNGPCITYMPRGFPVDGSYHSMGAHKLINGWRQFVQNTLQLCKILGLHGTGESKRVFAQRNASSCTIV